MYGAEIITCRLFCRASLPLALKGLAKILTVVATRFRHQQLKEQLPRAGYGGLQVAQ